MGMGVPKITVDKPDKPIANDERVSRPLCEVLFITRGHFALVQNEIPFVVLYIFFPFVSIVLVGWEFFLKQNIQV